MNNRICEKFVDIDPFSRIHKRDKKSINKTNESNLTPVDDSFLSLLIFLLFC